MLTSRAWLVAVLALVLPAGAQSAPSDGDRDGLDDALEGRLLEQFRPSFLVSAQDCDQLPSEMAPGEPAPRAVAHNGTIYGQAMPRPSGAIELHYFHLWSRDCGRRSHAGDVEHVSALLQPQGDGSWRAQYWYAAAHEGTVCDRCMAVRAEDVRADSRGPAVWISEGKHASYLSQKLCNGGCGGDSCPDMRALPALPIVNLGEAGAPLNGALWTASPTWPLTSRLQPDFDEALVASLAASNAEGPVRVTVTTRGMQRTISVSNTTLGGLETAEDHTGDALGTAKKSTGNALQRSYRAVRSWLHGSK